MGQMRFVNRICGFVLYRLLERCFRERFRTKSSPSHIESFRIYLVFVLVKHSIESIFTCMNIRLRSQAVMYTKGERDGCDVDGNFSPNRWPDSDTDRRLAIENRSCSRSNDRIISATHRRDKATVDEDLESMFKAQVAWLVHPPRLITNFHRHMYIF